MVELKHSFPDRFFEEEDRLGFHIDRKRKEVWAVELDMLLELDRVCRKLNIRYFLDGGTLLGAARDGLFIPWDDDIDVAMLREDYDRFVRQAPEEFDYPLFLQTGYTEKDYFRGHCQLRNSETAAILPNELGRVRFNQGIFLDVFVLDELFVERIAAQYEERKRLQRFRKKSLNRAFQGRPLKWLAKQVCYGLFKLKYPDSATFYRRLEKVFRAQTQSEYVDYLMLNRGVEQVHRLRRDWYREAVPLWFEGLELPAPQGYREYLRCYYGEDWETPKNVDSMHNAKGQVLFDTGRSYVEVLNEIEAANI